MTATIPTRPSGYGATLDDLEELSGVQLRASLRNDITELNEIDAARANLALKGDKTRTKLATEKSEASGRDALAVHAAIKAKKPPEAVKFDDRGTRSAKEGAGCARPPQPTRLPARHPFVALPNPLRTP